MPRLRSFAAPLAALGLVASSLLTVPLARADHPLPEPPGSSCDPIDPSLCLLPFPNDWFTVADSSTDTGRRLAIDTLATPRNSQGLPIRTDGSTGWNGNDGFSPGSPVVTYVDGLDLGATWGESTDHITDLSWFARPDAPMLLIDADTGERHPFWSELDTAAARPYEVGADRRALILRPTTNFEHGHRYLVVLRDLRDASGAPIAAGSHFAAMRDGIDTSARAVEVDRILTEAAAAETARGNGFDRSTVHLAWEFTVASTRNLTERVLAMRDDAFATLGDTTMADRVYDGVAPSFTVDKVIERDGDPVTARTIRGAITVPNYLTVSVDVDAAVPGAVAQPLLDAGFPGADAAADRSQPVAVTRTHLNDTDGDGIPERNVVQPDLEVAYECHLPATATAADPAMTAYYGHGLLGNKSQSRGYSTNAMAASQNVAYCSIDWMGMALGDLPNIATVMHDLSNFPSFADRVQQGFVNQLFLGRVFAHVDGFAAHPAFQDDAGQPLIETEAIVYDGNSQGGILGGAVVALSPDIVRGNLGVPGQNYSTLLNRSVDWEGLFGEPYYPNYPDKLTQQLNFSLMQQLWDRAENNAYSAHLTDHPLPNTPPHEVMMQVAFSDHQVTNVSAEVMARTSGVALKVPSLQPVDGPQPAHWSVDEAFGLGTVQFDPNVVDPGTGLPVLHDAGSVLLYWYSQGLGNVTPPNGNVPAEAGADPHSHIREDLNASLQKVHWLRTGDLLDVCGGVCVTRPSTRY